ncbi:hypothetical protein MNBD_ALPHA11-1934 [hydrothermal vent metagenome]|uniref:Uncharacterized protein n=1 Tax=hydrothermal vent metagenome TaxID=652676 RepID=A0A3B0TZR5_9ZZZZ
MCSGLMNKSMPPSRQPIICTICIIIGQIYQMRLKRTLLPLKKKSPHESQGPFFNINV